MIPDHRAEGSLSLEGALSVSIFLFFCMAVISFLLIFYVHISIQHSLTDMSLSIGEKAYLLSAGSENLKKYEGSGTAKKEDGSSDILSAGINPLTVKLWLQNMGRIKNTVDRSRVIEGRAGLYTYDTVFDEKNGILDAVIKYDYKIPWLPGSLGTLRFVQRLRSRVWTGRSLTERGENGRDKDPDTVYITENGSVYHTSKSCHYLDLSIHGTTASQVVSQRNANGSRYERCSHCTERGYSGTAYITDYGSSWHSSLECSGLKRTVIEVAKSDATGMRMCTKCAGEK